MEEFRYRMHSSAALIANPLLRKVLTVNGQLTMETVSRMFLPKLLEDARENLPREI
jgi:hypothetical protein